MPNRREIILGCILIASIALNVWLVGVDREPANAARSAAATPSAVRPVAVDLAPSLPPLETCNRQVIALQAELSSAKEDLAQRIDAQQRFNEGAREPGMETRLGPALDGAFAKLRSVTAHAVECRTDICQVRVTAPSRELAKQAWRALISDPELLKITDGFMQDGGEPVIDLATGKGGFDVNLYMLTRSAADATSQIQALVEQFRGTDAIASCGSAGSDRGVLEARITVDDNRVLAVTVGGSLGGTAVGRCISQKLVDLAQRFQLPVGAQYGTVYASFASPHGEW